MEGRLEETKEEPLLELKVSSQLRWPLELVLAAVRFLRPLLSEELQVPDLCQHRPRRVDAHLLRHEADMEEAPLCLRLPRGGLVPLRGIAFRVLLATRLWLLLLRLHWRAKWFVECAP